MMHYHRWVFFAALCFRAVISGSVVEVGVKRQVVATP
ncbi:hypothetical protein ABIF64_004916 [Bradyrhizobium japonicum]|jgi:hypothetical protein|nr:hypothetical protein [Bradyrhizobium japonicum]MCP1789409.1 hypothetical protein [Bradyrhizobium japonicum]MCP1801908.1 hypothetical protein [Bradyrhizobium japonicum]MCP1820219.1 hypothetical protein [Bradyrhizobium japonicum]MCP1868273.1 hypothetical protein [Bradyrhizobium japonicum]